MLSNKTWLQGLLAATLLGAGVPAGAQSIKQLATATVGLGSANGFYQADGQLEAIRETIIAAQVAGKVLTRTVRAGDQVKAGQLLVQIDPRAAQQSQAASAAQLAAAKAQLVAAEKNLERTRQLVSQNYMSPANLDKVEADFKAASETVRALSAQMAGAAAQTGWHTLSAPFDAVVTATYTEVGDTAMPGKPLIQLHDPSALRVAMNVPASIVARLRLDADAHIEIPDAGPALRNPKPGRIVVVSAADPVSHTQLVRIDLPRELGDLHPGMFARIGLPLQTDPGSAQRLLVPVSALVARGDLRAVYVVAESTVVLRQVRVGRRSGDDIEILAGLAAGEKVAIDPVAAARIAGVSNR
jgi:multidrug efflux system membrane fusion protein